MLKYIKYFIPGITAISYIIIISRGEYYPTIFLIGFSLFIIIGDVILPRDTKIQHFTYPSILNLSIYINLPILLVTLFLTISLLSENLSQWYINVLNNFIYTDFNQTKNTLNIIDKISLIIQTSLLTGILGVVPAHELTHRIKDKFDMFIGNWLLALSWDCTFAIEHVYGHHKNACLPEDPASAKKGENIYLFILKAILNEHIDGWKIEIRRVKKNNQYPFGINNKMVIGYMRSLIITFFIFAISGISGVLFFLLCALVTKSFLESINYVEHYGLVRSKDQRMDMRHSWNSNHAMSSIFLYNVTRHSDHHRLAKLKFWELNPCPKNAPMTPFGYLTMLYIVLLAPYVYQKIMEKKLIEWKLNYANEIEKNLIQKLN